MKTFITSAVTLFVLLSGAVTVFAATDTIDATNHYAWNDNGGWVNWNANGGNVTVTDTTLTGYIWSADFGWINLAPTNGGVTNNNGTLGGWAWGANTGWISFSGVIIDSNGVFHGTTVAQNVFGTMTFDCTNCDVVTSWRAGSSSSNSSASSGGGGGPISGPLAVGYQSGTTTTQSTSTTTATTSIPTTLVPTSKPSKTQPTTKPPASIKSSAYTSQQLPTSTTLPTSTVQTSPKDGKAVAGQSTPHPMQSCSWFGACLWQSIVNFFAHLFGHR